MYHASRRIWQNERTGFLLSLSIIALFLISSGANGQVKRRPVFNSVLQIQNVIIYENPNFGG